MCAIRKDYLVKQFEEFGKVMASIFSLRKEKDWENFKKQIAEAALKYADLEVDYVENLKESEFEQKILQNPSLHPDQLKMLSDLLFEKMNYYIEINDTVRSSDLQKKCILLYQKFNENLTQNDFNLDVHYKLNYLHHLK